MWAASVGTVVAQRSGPGGTTHSVEHGRVHSGVRAPAC
jgi:hypothetical protein